MVIKLLLVEDDWDSAQLVKHELARQKASIHFAVHRNRTLAGALNYLGRVQVDLVIADLGLPDSCGLATLTNLKSAAADTPVIVLSAEDSDETIWQMLCLGAEDYIVKAERKEKMLVASILNSIARQFESGVGQADWPIFNAV